ncbi:MAG: hypothetical protein ACREH5_03725 [Candidatus Omnitrophota bacterium]
MSFLATDLAYAAAFEGAQRPVSAGELLAHDPLRLEIPSEYAKLQEVYKGQNDTLLIHIQDAHSNLSGQENLANALDQILSRHKVNLVLVEGGAGDVSLTPIKDAAPADVWKKVAKSFLIEGKLSGEEYLNLASDHPMRIMGIEDEGLYFESLRAYSDLASRRAETLDYLARIRRSVEKIKQKLYPAEILEYEKQKSHDNFETRFKGLMGLWRHFEPAEGEREISYKKGISRPFGPRDDNLQKLLRLKEQEKHIDFDLANLEQAALAEEIVKRGGGEDLRAHLETSHGLKGDKLSQYAHFQNTLEIAQKRNIALSKYPTLLKYGEYLKEFTLLDLEAVLEEMERFENGVYPTFLTTQDQRLIRAVDRHLALLQTAFQIRMTTKEFEQFRANEPDFGTVPYLAFVNRKLAELGYTEDFVAYEHVVEEGKKALEAFYDSVTKRDFAFIENTERILKEKNEKIAVLISGGYHTAHLKQLFKEKGYSYAVLTPVVSGESIQTKYERLLLAPLQNGKKTAQALETSAWKNSDGIRRWAAARFTDGKISTVIELKNAAARLAVISSPPKADEKSPTTRRSLGRHGDLEMTKTVFARNEKKATGARLAANGGRTFSTILEDHSALSDTYEHVKTLSDEIIEDLRGGADPRSGALNGKAAELSRTLEQLKGLFKKEEANYPELEKKVRLSIAAAIEHAEGLVDKFGKAIIALAAVDFTELNFIAQSYGIDGFGDKAAEFLFESLQAPDPSMARYSEHLFVSPPFGGNILYVNAVVDGANKSIDEEYLGRLKAHLAKVKRQVREKAAAFVETFLQDGAFVRKLTDKLGEENVKREIEELRERVRNITIDFSVSGMQLMGVEPRPDRNPMAGWQKSRGLQDIMAGKLTPESWNVLLDQPLVVGQLNPESWGILKAQGIVEGEMNDQKWRELQTRRLVNGPFPFAHLTEERLRNIEVELDNWLPKAESGYRLVFDRFLALRRKILFRGIAYLLPALEEARNTGRKALMSEIRHEKGILSELLLTDMIQKDIERKVEMAQLQKLAASSLIDCKLLEIVEGATRVEDGVFVHDDTAARVTVKEEIVRVGRELDRTESLPDDRTWVEELMAAHYRILQKARANVRPLHQYRVTGAFSVPRLPRPMHYFNGMTRASASFKQWIEPAQSAVDRLRENGASKNAPKVKVDENYLSIFFEQFHGDQRTYDRLWHETFILAPRDVRLPEGIQFQFFPEVLEADAGGKLERIQAVLENSLRQADAGGDHHAVWERLRELTVPGAGVVRRPFDDLVLVYVRDKAGVYHWFVIEFNSVYDTMRAFPPDLRDSLMHEILLEFLSVAKGHAGQEDMSDVSRQLLARLEAVAASKGITEVPKTKKLKLHGKSGPPERMPLFKIPEYKSLIFAKTSEGGVLAMQLDPRKEPISWTMKADELKERGAFIPTKFGAIIIEGVTVKPADVKEWNRLQELLRFLDNLTKEAKIQSEISGQEGADRSAFHISELVAPEKFPELQDKIASYGGSVSPKNGSGARLAEVYQEDYDGQKYEIQIHSFKEAVTEGAEFRTVKVQGVGILAEGELWEFDLGKVDVEHVHDEDTRLLDSHWLEGEEPAGYTLRQWAQAVKDPGSVLGVLNADQGLNLEKSTLNFETDETGVRRLYIKPTVVKGIMDPEAKSIGGKFFVMNFGKANGGFHEIELRRLSGSLLQNSSLKHRAGAPGVTLVETWEMPVRKNDGTEAVYWVRTENGRSVQVKRGDSSGDELKDGVPFGNGFAGPLFRRPSGENLITRKEHGHTVREGIERFDPNGKGLYDPRSVVEKISKARALGLDLSETIEELRFRARPATEGRDLGWEVKGGREEIDHRLPISLYGMSADGKLVVLQLRGVHSETNPALVHANRILYHLEHGPEIPEMGDRKPLKVPYWIVAGTSADVSHYFPSAGKTAKGQPRVFSKLQQALEDKPLLKVLNVPPAEVWSAKRIFDELKGEISNKPSPDAFLQRLIDRQMIQGKELAQGGNAARHPLGLELKPLTLEGLKMRLLVRGVDLAKWSLESPEDYLHLLELMEGHEKARRLGTAVVVRQKGPAGARMAKNVENSLTVLIRASFNNALKESETRRISLEKFVAEPDSVRDTLIDTLADVGSEVLKPLQENPSPYLIALSLYFGLTPEDGTFDPSKVAGWIQAFQGRLVSAEGREKWQALQEDFRGEVPRLLEEAEEILGDRERIREQMDQLIEQGQIELMDEREVLKLPRLYAPDDPDKGLFLAAHYFERLGDIQRAREIYDKVIRQGRGTQSYKESLMRLFDLEARARVTRPFEKAKHELQQTLMSGPSHAEVPPLINPAALSRTATFLGRFINGEIETHRLSKSVHDGAREMKGLWGLRKALRKSGLDHDAKEKIRLVALRHELYGEDISAGIFAANDNRLKQKIKALKKLEIDVKDQQDIKNEEMPGIWEHAVQHTVQGILPKIKDEYFVKAMATWLTPGQLEKALAVVNAKNLEDRAKWDNEKAKKRLGGRRKEDLKQPKGGQEKLNEDSQARIRRIEDTAITSSEVIVAFVDSLESVEAMDTVRTFFEAHDKKRFEDRVSILLSAIGEANKRASLGARLATASRLAADFRENPLRADPPKSLNEVVNDPIYAELKAELERAGAKPKQVAMEIYRKHYLPDYVRGIFQSHGFEVPFSTYAKSGSLGDVVRIRVKAKGAEAKDLAVKVAGGKYVGTPFTKVANQNLERDVRAFKILTGREGMLVQGVPAYFGDVRTEGNKLVAVMMDYVEGTPLNEAIAQNADAKAGLVTKLKVLLSALRQRGLILWDVMAFDFLVTREGDIVATDLGSFVDTEEVKKLGQPLSVELAVERLTNLTTITRPANAGQGARLAQTFIGTAPTAEQTDPETLVLIARALLDLKKISKTLPFEFKLGNALITAELDEKRNTGWVYFYPLGKDGKPSGKPFTKVKLTEEIVKQAKALKDSENAIRVKIAERSDALEVFADDQKFIQTARQFYDQLKKNKAPDVEFNNDRTAVLRFVTAKKLRSERTALYRKQLRTLHSIAGKKVLIQFAQLRKNGAIVLYGPSDPTPAEGEDHALFHLSELSRKSLKAAKLERAGFVSVKGLADDETVIPFVAQGVFLTAVGRLSGYTDSIQQLWRNVRGGDALMDLDPEAFRDIRKVRKADLRRYSKLQLRAIDRIAWERVLEYTRLALQADTAA